MDYDFELEEIQEGEEDTRDEESSEEIIPNEPLCKGCIYYLSSKNLRTFIAYCPVLSLGLNCERKNN